MGDRDARCAADCSRVRAGGRQRLRAAVFLLALVAAVAGAVRDAPRAGAGTLPNNFQESVVFSGLTQPTAVRFASDGRMFVAEKSGLIKVFDCLTDTTPTVFADLRTEVYNYWDRGLLGPGARTRTSRPIPTSTSCTRYDARHRRYRAAWGTPGVYPTRARPAGPDQRRLRRQRPDLATDRHRATSRPAPSRCSSTTGASSTRATRSASLASAPTARCTPSGGDGASFTFADYGQDGNPREPLRRPTRRRRCGARRRRPPRAARSAARTSGRTGDPTTLDGTVIRDRPGHRRRAAGQPVLPAPTPNARRIVAYGLRNPFRFTIRPGTSEIWVGDVGWDDLGGDRPPRPIRPTRPPTTSAGRATRASGRQPGVRRRQPRTLREPLRAPAPSIRAVLHLQALRAGRRRARPA